MRGPRRLISDYRERTRAEQESADEHVRDRIAQQWAEVRAARRALEAQPQILGGASNLKPARVPYGMDLAAAWAWRFIVVCGALAIILWLLNLFLVVVLPVVIALLIAALVSPVVVWGRRLGLPRKLSALLTVVLGIGLIALLVTFVSNHVSNGIGDLSSQVSDGIQQIRNWLHDGPLHITDKQLSDGLDKAQEQIKSYGEDSVGKLGEATAEGFSKQEAETAAAAALLEQLQ